MRFKEKRNMKVYAGNDHNYKPVAQIRLPFAEKKPCNRTP